jgi:DNA repair protein RecN (Recombination protein N)
MLRHLTVENYALIEQLDLELDSRLSIITGETGAGKSILLGALGLLLGNKNDNTTFRDSSRSCIIEGTFDVEGYALESFFEDNDLDYEPQLVIRRMISPAGKSRAFVNDMPVQLSVLKELGSHLIDIHSQHQNLILSDESFRLHVVDTVAGAGEQLALYRNTYASLRQAERELNDMIASAEALRKDEEWLRYQVSEFEAAALRVGELEEAEAELSVLENSEQIGESLALLRQSLDAEQIGVLEQLAASENMFSKLGDGYRAGEELSERLRSVIAELKDISATAADEAERVEANPERQQKLSDRINVIYSLCQKHRVQRVDELIKVGEEYAARLSAITHSDENITHQRSLIASLTKQAEAQAAELHTLRVDAAREVSQGVRDMLRRLGMEEVHFDIVVEQCSELTSTGTDKVKYMFSANARIAPQPVEKIASGGELSRVMLSLKALLATHSKLPTIIFDEIDTGVSGRIADAMGDIIRSLSLNMQVVAITHLPQVAAKGDSHFVVYKEQSRTHLSRLTSAERVEEIAKMLSGSDITAAALEQARILLQ